MASLCTLRLLNQLDDSEIAEGRIKCVAFAAPALGNRALAEIVQQQGWSHVFYNLTLPGMSVLAAPSVCIGGCTLARFMGSTKSLLSDMSSFLSPSKNLAVLAANHLHHSILPISVRIVQLTYPGRLGFPYLHKVFWPSLRLHCILAEDIVPGLLAMRYAARLPAAAADAMPQPPKQEAAVHVSSAVPEWQKAGIGRPLWSDASASGAVPPLKPAWHGSLSSSLDKLRGLTGSTANGSTAPATQSTPADNGSLQSRPGTAPSADQIQSAEGTSAREQQQSQQSSLGKTYVPTWGPARYLPAFVPFGGQHYLYAPAAAPSRSTVLQTGPPEPNDASEAEDTEALVALEAQRNSSGQPQASDGSEPQQTAELHQSHSTARSERSSSGHSRAAELHESSRAQAEAERVALTRKYALPLTYHRMCTMRKRAAAICETAWPLRHDSAGREAVQLSRGLAPRMEVSAASAQLPVLPPQRALQARSASADSRFCFRIELICHYQLSMLHLSARKHTEEHALLPQATVDITNCKAS